MTLEERLMLAVPHIRASLERSPCGSTLEEVLTEIAKGNAKLWLGQESAIVTQAVPMQSIWHAGGDLKDLVETMQAIWPVMQAQGFTTLSVSDTRKGWSKVLKEHGFVEEHSLVLEA